MSDPALAQTTFLQQVTYEPMLRFRSSVRNDNLIMF
jgi:hypothetical protein